MNNVLYNPHVLNCRISGSLSRKMYSFISRKFLEDNVSPVNRRLLTLLIIHYSPDFVQCIDQAMKNNSFQENFLPHFLSRMQKFLGEKYNFRFRRLSKRLTLPTLSKANALFKKMNVVPRPEIREMATSPEAVFFLCFRYNTPGDRSVLPSLSKIDRNVIFDLNRERIVGITSVFEKYMQSVTRKLDSRDDPVSNVKGYGILGPYETLWFRMERLFINPLKDTLMTQSFSSVNEKELLAEDLTLAIVFRYMIEAIEYVLWKNPEENIWEYLKSQIFFTTNSKYTDFSSYEKSDFVVMFRYLFDPTSFQEKVQNVIFLDVLHESGKHTFIESPNSPFKFVESSIPGMKKIAVSENNLTIIPPNFRNELEKGILCSYGNPSISGDELMTELRYKVDDPYRFLDTINRFFVYFPEINRVSFSSFVKTQGQMAYAKGRFSELYIR